MRTMHFDPLSEELTFDFSNQILGTLRFNVSQIKTDLDLKEDRGVFLEYSNKLKYTINPGNILCHHRKLTPQDEINIINTMSKNFKFMETLFTVFGLIIRDNKPRNIVFLGSEKITIGDSQDGVDTIYFNWKNSNVDLKVDNQYYFVI